MKKLSYSLVVAMLMLVTLLSSCKKPDEKIVLRQIRDVVVDADESPTLKANAVFFNPNDVKGKLRHIDVDIYVNGKKSASVDQELKTVIPANAEFTVPLIVNLSVKELGFMDTLLGVVGGKKFLIRYVGHLRLNYRGIPVKVPVDHKDEVRITF